MQPSITKLKGSRGFTLLEVLLSAFILFLVLTSSTLVYRGALLSSGKAEQALKLTEVVLPVRRIISDQIQSGIGDFNQMSGNRQGQGSFGGVEYDWVAVLSLVSTQNQTVVEEEGPRLKFFLWSVDVRLREGRAVRKYRFSEISW